MKTHWLKWAFPLVLILVTAYFFWIAPMQREPQAIQFDFIPQSGN
jgi:preprotein translocase subunit YajC